MPIDGTTWRPENSSSRMSCRTLPDEGFFRTLAREKDLSTEAASTTATPRFGPGVHVWTAPRSKRFVENSDGRIDCEHVCGLSTRHHVRCPGWNPRSSPKQFRGFESRHANRVLWIIGSTDRHLIQLFHPGINARLRR